MTKTGIASNANFVTVSEEAKASESGLASWKSESSRAFFLGAGILFIAWIWFALHLAGAV